MKQRRRVAGLLREIGHRLVASDADDAEFEEIAAALEPVHERLAAHGVRPNDFRISEGGELEYPGIFDFNPVTGRSNPLAPPLKFVRESDHVWAELTFRSGHEGAPGCVHGGWIAAAFDEVLGVTFTLAMKLAMTGRLTVRYRKPVPIDTPLRFEGRVARVSGRKVFAHAHLHAGDTLLAEAEGLFIGIELERFADFARTRNQGGDVGSD